MNEKTKSILKLILKIAVVLSILLVVIFNYESLKTIDIRVLVEGKSLLLAVLLILGVYLTKSILFVIPAMLVYTSVGVAYSPGIAIAINLCGIFLEVSATYLLGLFLGGDYVKNLLSKNKGGRKILEKQFENKFPTLLVVRALPIFPIDFLSLFLGSVKSNFLTYIIASVVGIAPRVILFTILGNSIYDYIPTQTILKIVIIILPLAAIGFVAKFIFEKRKKGAVNEEIKNV